MPVYRLQMTMPWTTGAPPDVVVNTWHCDADNDAAAIVFRQKVQDFYASIDAALSPLFDPAADACTAKLYDLADDEPRVPVNVDEWTLSPGNDTPLPPELAVCLSFQGTPQSGVNQARKRNRVFLGPFNSLSTDNSTAIVDTNGRPATHLLDAIRDAAQTLLNESNSIGSFAWIVWSELAGGENVVNGWVDDEWDTQRRRGRLATTRLTFTE